MCFPKVFSESRRSVGAGEMGETSASERPARSRTGVSVTANEPAALRQLGWYREVLRPLGWRAFFVDTDFCKE